MGRLINLDLSSVRYDRFRDAFIVMSGSTEVAIVHEALEAYASRSLTQDECYSFLESCKVPFSRMANSLSAIDGIITITPHTVLRGSWDVACASDDGEEL